MSVWQDEYTIIDISDQYEIFLVEQTWIDVTLLEVSVK